MWRHLNQLVYLQSIFWCCKFLTNKNWPNKVFPNTFSQFLCFFPNFVDIFLKTIWIIPPGLGLVRLWPLILIKIFFLGKIHFRKSHWGKPCFTNFGKSSFVKNSRHKTQRAQWKIALRNQMWIKRLRDKIIKVPRSLWTICIYVDRQTTNGNL